MTVLAIANPTSLLAQTVSLMDAAPPQTQKETADGSGKPQQGYEFLGPDGRPLPAEIQAQMREQFKRNPPQMSADGEILIRAQRPRGSVVTDAAPERSLSSIDLGSYGTSNVGELVEALGPQVASPRSQRNERPLLLLNGRRVANPLDIASIPTEAIERLDVFPEQLAILYGLQTDRKILNIVTFEQYGSVFASATGLLATEGGYQSGSTGVDLFMIKGDVRSGLGVSYSRNGSLAETERNIAEPLGSIGQGVFRTLLPREETIAINGNIARPIGESSSASISGRFRSQDSDGLVGRVGPAILERSAGSDELELGTNVARQIGRGLLSFETTYTDRTETALILSSVDRQTIDASDLQSQNLRANFTVAGPVITLPGGLVSGSLVAEASTSKIKTDTLQAIPNTSDSRVRNLNRVALNLVVPVLTEESDIGRVVASYGLAFSKLSDVKDARELNVRIDWSPTQLINLSFSLLSERKPPPLSQLGAPTLLSPNVRVLDFITGDTVDVDFITGGNADLRNEARRDFQFIFRARPFSRINLSLNATFTSTQIDDTIASFPLLTTVTSAAFPERFVRTGEQRLMRVDTRPINFLQSKQDQLFWGFSFIRPFGKMSGSDHRPERLFRSEDDARSAFPGDLIVSVAPSNTLARQAENLTSRIFLNLYHTWFTRDVVKLAPDTPDLNLLTGDAVDFLGGRRQHRIQLDAGFYKSGIGARIDIDWSSATSLVDTGLGGAQTLNFGEFATVDVNAFVNLAEALGAKSFNRWWTGSRLTLAVENLINQRPAVRTAEGTVPLRYQRPYLDPLGRTVSISFRKTF